MHVSLFPDSASTIAPKVDAVFWGISGICAVVLLGICLTITYFIYKYRATNRHVDRSPPSPNFKSWKLEVLWTTIPTLIFMGMFIPSAWVYFEMKVPPKDVLEVHVVGKQWMWRIQHFEGKREINQLHVPLGQNVKLLMTSEDVIHSFFIPSFRIKQDVVPGRYSVQWFKATKPGVYHLFCSEYCGTEHADMKGEVVVMKPAEYQAWIGTGLDQNSLITRGEKLFHQFGCSGCHGEGSKIRAPSLVGVYGKPVPLETGEIVTADDEYIRDSILEPSKQIVAGYENVMPSFQGQISQEDIFALISYIKSLGSAMPQEYRRPGAQSAADPNLPFIQEKALEGAKQSTPGGTR